MADLKISQLNSITTLTPATDVLPVVDVTGTTKKITTNQILGSGGTATLASATISGDLTVDTSTLKVDSANDRVGVGITSPTVRLHTSVAAPTRGIVSKFQNSSSGTTGSYLSIAAVGANVWSLGLPSGSGDFAIYSARDESADGTERLRIDTSGNVGIGVTPSAWASFKTIQTQYACLASNLFGAGNLQTFIGSNVFYDGSYKYIVSDTAARYAINSNSHVWFQSASGTAGNVITFTQAMTLDASGNLLLGTTSSPTGTKIGSITKLGGVSVEGTNYINVSTTQVPIARAMGTGGLFFVAGYNPTGGAQGWWLVASTGASVATVIASGNNTTLTVAFTQVSGVLHMNTTSGTVAVTAISITN